MLGQNSSPALKQLGPMTGPSRAIGPLLFSANSGHIPARLSDSVMRVKRQLKQHDYLCSGTTLFVQERRCLSKAQQRRSCRRWRVPAKECLCLHYSSTDSISSPRYDATQHSA